MKANQFLYFPVKLFIFITNTLHAVDRKIKIKLDLQSINRDKPGITNDKGVRVEPESMTGNNGVEQEGAHRGPEQRDI